MRITLVLLFFQLDIHELQQYFASGRQTIIILLFLYVLMAHLVSRSSEQQFI